MEKILSAVASGLKLDAAKFLADFKNGDDWKTEEEIAEQLADFVSDKVKAANETARKTGRSESAQKIARLVKNSGFENPDNLQGDALFSAFIEWKDEQAAQHVDGDPAKFSKEDLLKLPTVKGIVSEVTAKAVEKFAAEKKALEERVQQSEGTRVRMLARSKVLTIAEKAKINMGESAEQKNLRVDLIMSRFPISQFEVGENDAIKFLGADGYESDFEKAVNDIAIPAFGVVTQDKNRGGSGAQGSGNGTGGNASEYKPVHTFTGEADFNAKVVNAKDNVERNQLWKDWRFQQATEKEAAGK